MIKQKNKPKTKQHTGTNPQAANTDMHVTSFFFPRSICSVCARGLLCVLFFAYHLSRRTDKRTSNLALLPVFCMAPPSTKVSISPHYSRLCPPPKNSRPLCVGVQRGGGGRGYSQRGPPSAAQLSYIHDAPPTSALEPLHPALLVLVLVLPLPAFPRLPSPS